MRVKTIKCLTKTEIEEVRVLIAHALEDLSYGGEGTYTLLDKDGERTEDERLIKKAKRGIATVARLLEELKQ